MSGIANLKHVSPDKPDHMIHLSGSALVQSGSHSAPGIPSPLPAESRSADQKARLIDGYTLEQLEKLLDIRDRLDALQSSGAKKNSDRAIEHHGKWEARAVELIQSRPSYLFNFKSLAREVAEWCPVHKVTMKNGKPYKSRTIYEHLLDRRTAVAIAAGIRSHTA